MFSDAPGTDQTTLLKLSLRDWGRLHQLERHIVAKHFDWVIEVCARWITSCPKHRRPVFGNCFRKSNFFVKLLNNRYSSEMCPEKSIFCEITWKNRNFSEICPESWFFLWNCLKKSEIFLENWNVFGPDPRPPNFKPDWRRWSKDRR